MSDLVFVDGLRVFPPRAKAPDFIKGAMLINRDEMIAWLQAQPDEEVRLDIKAAKPPKTSWYCTVDNWKPENQQGKGPAF